MSTGCCDLTIFDLSFEGVGTAEFLVVSRKGLFGAGDTIFRGLQFF